MIKLDDQSLMKAMDQAFKLDYDPEDEESITDVAYDLEYTLGFTDQQAKEIIAKSDMNIWHLLTAVQGYSEAFKHDPQARNWYDEKIAYGSPSSVVRAYIMLRSYYLFRTQQQYQKYQKRA